MQHLKNEAVDMARRIELLELSKRSDPQSSYSLSKFTYYNLKYV